MVVLPLQSYALAFASLEIKNSGGRARTWKHRSASFRNVYQTSNHNFREYRTKSLFYVLRFLVVKSTKVRPVNPFAFETKLNHLQSRVIFHCIARTLSCMNEDMSFKTAISKMTKQFSI